jgi:WD40 repeat protein
MKVVHGRRRRAAVAIRDGTVRVWDLTTGRPVCTLLTSHTDEIRAVASPDPGDAAMRRDDDPNANMSGAPDD